jgi:hypothetical protein
MIPVWQRANWATPSGRLHLDVLSLFDITESDSLYAHGTQTGVGCRGPLTIDFAVDLPKRLIRSQRLQHSRTLLIADTPPHHFLLYQALRLFPLPVELSWQPITQAHFQSYSITCKPAAIHVLISPFFTGQRAILPAPMCRSCTSQITVVGLVQTAALGLLSHDPLDIDQDASAAALPGIWAAPGHRQVGSTAASQCQGSALATAMLTMFVVAEDMMTGRPVVPDDFPREPAPEVPPGAQPKLLMREIERCFHTGPTDKKTLDAL